MSQKIAKYINILGIIYSKNYKYRVAETPWTEDIQKGNAFRQWVNTEYPELASK